MPTELVPGLHAVPGGTYALAFGCSVHPLPPVAVRKRTVGATLGHQVRWWHPELAPPRRLLMSRPCLHHATRCRRIKPIRARYSSWRSHQPAFRTFGRSPPPSTPARDKGGGVSQHWGPRSLFRRPPPRPKRHLVSVKRCHYGRRFFRPPFDRTVARNQRPLRRYHPHHSSCCQFGGEPWEVRQDSVALAESRCGLAAASAFRADVQSGRPVTGRLGCRPTAQPIDLDGIQTRTSRPPRRRSPPRARPPAR